MNDEILTAFRGHTRLARGTRAELEADLAPLGPHPEGLLVFSDTTGRETDLNLTGAAPTPQRGRPKLGVKAREVTLLPRHWDWLARQRGGASAALRRLVEEARRAEAAQGPEATDRAYRFMSNMAGDLAGFEDAARALYAGDEPGFSAATSDWPPDIRDHALFLGPFP
ncbi:DUF2239 family protein [Maritimibacter sp. UBA3975]|uniref:DUF2239 family protein n=1 Tax=Maritimibacter sp. UBA3975 TaxID=1946833 RepID=UPI000C09515E|nr:DUF2239 family protein [Maritimibacter sp. UBA3975]MAM60294.1 hypothetical protein [Maritimibacter sp.]